MLGASHGGLTARFGDRVGGGVYTCFFRTRDLGTAHLLLGDYVRFGVSVMHAAGRRAPAGHGPVVVSLGVGLGDVVVSLGVGLGEVGGVVLGELLGELVGLPVGCGW